MNVGTLIELTGHLSTHSPECIESGRELPHEGLNRFLSILGTRCALWTRTLTPPQIGARTSLPLRRSGRAVEGVLADLFASEVATRVWASVVLACERVSHNSDNESIARKAVALHAQTRCKVMRRLIRRPDVDVRCLTRANRLRRRLQRWTDLLLGHLVCRYEVPDFAFDPDRACDFGEEFSDSGSRRGQAWKLYLLGLRTSFPPVNLAGGVFRELRDESFGAILACFWPEHLVAESSLRRHQRLPGQGIAQESPLGGFPSALRRLRPCSEHCSGNAARPVSV